jgi:feruloyl esterase
VAGKLLTEKFYGKVPSYSYYLGCSLGGRMGIKAAEVYPDDFDGIVAGCPAVDFNHLQGERALFYTITGTANSSNFISADLWTGLIHDEVLKQCDWIDGVEDGIIEVPDKCHFNPETLLCRPWLWLWQTNLQCLSLPHVLQLKQIYAPYIYGDGKMIFPRMNPGNEIMAVQKFFAGPLSATQKYEAPSLHI